MAEKLPVVEPVHPRTRERIDGVRAAPRTVGGSSAGLSPFFGLESVAALVLTDSGGVQEETTFLGVPCLTARPNTERPVTITMETNELVANRCDEILEAARRKLGQRLHAHRPPLWDGHTGDRIAQLFTTLA